MATCLVVLAEKLSIGFHGDKGLKAFTIPQCNNVGSENILELIELQVKLPIIMHLASKAEMPTGQKGTGTFSTSVRSPESLYIHTHAQCC